MLRELEKIEIRLKNSARVQLKKVIPNEEAIKIVDRAFKEIDRLYLNVQSAYISDHPFPEKAKKKLVQSLKVLMDLNHMINKGK